VALSFKQKNRIVFLLGYPGKILIADSTHFNRIFADRMENLNREIEDQVVTLLANLEDGRTKLTSSRDKGNVKRIGDIELDTNRTRSLVISDYRRLLRELSNLLDIPVRLIGGINFNISGP